MFGNTYIVYSKVKINSGEKLSDSKKSRFKHAIELTSLFSESILASKNYSQKLQPDIDCLHNQL